MSERNHDSPNTPAPDPRWLQACPWCRASAEAVIRRGRDEADRGIDEHDPSVHFDKAYRMFHAECSCGWIGAHWLAPHSAFTEAENHARIR